MDIRRAVITLIVGVRGYGKSKLALLKAQKAQMPYIFLDATNTFGTRGDNKLTWTDVKEEVNQWLKIKHLKGNGALYLYADTNAYKRLICTLWRLVELQAPLNFTLVIDEAQRYMSSAKIFAPLRKLVDESRHSQLSLIFVARRFAECHVYIRSQAEEIYTLRQSWPSDLQIVKQLYEHPEAVKKLPRDSFIKLL